MTSKVETLDMLPREGETVRTIKTLIRVRCDECGEAAHFRHTYLLPNCRTNTASSAYHKDDCSWCSDKEVFTCRECSRPEVKGYGWCSSFPANERFARMFMRWEEKEEAT